MNDRLEALRQKYKKVKAEEHRLREEAIARERAVLEAAQAARDATERSNQAWMELKTACLEEP